MANASDTSPYVLVSADSTLPNSQTLTAGTGLSVSSGGAGGNITVAADGALANFANLNGTPGFIVYNPSNKVVKTAVFESDGSIAISDPGGGSTPPIFGVVPQTTNQLIQVSGNAGSSVGNYPQINFSGTNGVSCSVSADAANNRILVSYSGLNAASQWSLYPAISNVNMAGYKIFSLSDPTDAQDAATKNYVDLHAGGAPTGAMYLVATADSSLTNEVNLGALATGLVLSTVAGGISTITTVPESSFQPADLVSTVTTVDATPTTLATISIPSNTAVTLNGNIVSRNSTFTDSTGGFFNATAINNGGTVTLVGSPVVSVNATSTALFNVIVSGTNLIVKVTGIAATTYNWQATYTTSSL